LTRKLSVSLVRFQPLSNGKVIILQKYQRYNLIVAVLLYNFEFDLRLDTDQFV
jgi:hypothetical protein